MARHKQDWPGIDLWNKVIERGFDYWKPDKNACAKPAKGKGSSMRDDRCPMLDYLVNVHREIDRQLREKREKWKKGGYVVMTPKRRKRKR